MKTTQAVMISMAVMAASCATPRVAQIDPVTNDVVLNSSGDDRSALPEARQAAPVTDSVDHYRDALKANPKDGRAWVGLARMQVVRREFTDAETSARQALRLDMKNREARKVLAEVAIRRGQADFAMIVLNGLGGVDSKDSQIVNMMALVALQQSRNDDAMALFKRALQINPSDIAVRMNLGVLHLRYRQVSQASTQFERVLAIMPDHEDARLHMAIVNAIRGNSSEAEKVYKSILGSKKDNPLALYNLAALEARSGDHEVALAHLKRYLEVSKPTAVESNQALALVDDIQRQRSAKGERISDDDIRVLATRMANESDVQGEIRKTAEAGVPAKPATALAVKKGELNSGDRAAEVVTQTVKAPAKAAPAKPAEVAAKPAPKVQPAKAAAAPAPKAPVEEGIEDLEQQLAH